MNFSFVFKLYLSSTFYYVQLNYKFLPRIQHSLPTSKLHWCCHAFLQERIHKSSPIAGGKACAILEGRAQKDVFPFTQEKNGGRVQKMKNNDFRRTRYLKWKISDLRVCSKTHWCDIMPVNARNCVKDTTLTTQCFLGCFIFIAVSARSILWDTCKSNHH